MNFYDSGAFGCIVWALIGGLLYGASRLIAPLINLVPVSSSERSLLILVWSLFLGISVWCLLLTSIGGNFKARTAFFWSFYGGLGMLGISLVLLGVCQLIGV